MTLTMPPINLILDDPEIVLTRKDDRTTLIGVWHGGVCFDVYTDETDDGGEWRTVDEFNHSGDGGQPLDAEDARASLEDRLDRLAYGPA